MKDFTIHELVRKLESDDKSGVTNISKYVQFNQRENIEKIDAYKNSKHLSGETDSQGREKPFFNIVTAARNIWFRATDIDRKQIKIKAAKVKQYALAFIATIILQEWMKKNHWGKFLNKWGLTLASYGSAILKFVEKDGELHSEVMPWSRMIVDPVDFEGNPKVEKLWFTPAQLLKKKEYDQDYVQKLLDAVESRETPEGQDKDTKAEYIPVYEIHGEMPLSYLTREEDDDYVQQMHVISFVEKRDDGEGEWEDYTLYKGREPKDPYVLTHLIEEEGRTQSIGAIEHLFQAQWIQNHTAKTIKDQLDLASKLIFQTSDGNFVGQSALNSIDNGDILVHKQNEPLEPIYNQADIVALQSYGQQWKQQANEINGISEAMLGAAPKSGTAWRQTEALLMESHSLFETMTENKGNSLEEILRDFVIPHIKKKMDTGDEISAILEDHQIEKLNTMYIPNKAVKIVNQKIKDAILSGKAFTKEEQEEQTQIETDNLTKMMQSLGNQRFFNPSQVGDKIWKSVLEGFEWDLDIDITGEAKDRQAVMTTLDNVFKTIAGSIDPNTGRSALLENPKAKMIFNRILSETGAISPIELEAVGNQGNQEATSPREQPRGGQVGVAPQQQLAPTQ